MVVAAPDSERVRRYARILARRSAPRVGDPASSDAGLIDETEPSGRDESWPTVHSRERTLASVPEAARGGQIRLRRVGQRG